MQAKRRSLEEPGDLRSRLPWAREAQTRGPSLFVTLGFAENGLGGG